MTMAGSAVTPDARLIDWVRTSTASDGSDTPSTDPLCGIRVLVVDDCTLHREGLAALMATNGAPDVSVAWDLPTVTAAVRDKPVNVVLLNVSTLDGVILLRAVQDIAPYVRVIVVGSPRRMTTGSLRAPRQVPRDITPATSPSRS